MTKNVVLGLVALVALAGAVFMLTRSGNSPTAVPDEYDFHGVCLSCKEESDSKQLIRENPPYTCPKCSTAALYPMFYCETCKMTFVPPLVQLTGQPPRIPQQISCPKCNGVNIQAYDPLGFDPADVKGMLPLPNWKP